MTAEPQHAAVYELAPGFPADVRAATDLDPIGDVLLAVPALEKASATRAARTQLSILNKVTAPGFTDFAFYLYDQNGLLDFVCEKLNEQQVEYIDLATWGYVTPNFHGSALVSAEYWEHDVFSPDGNFLFSLVDLGAVLMRSGPAEENAADATSASLASALDPVLRHLSPAHLCINGPAPIPSPTPPSPTTPPPAATTPPVPTETPTPTATSTATTPEPTVTRGPAAHTVWLPVAHCPNDS
jgi:hypothetical protein